MVAPEMGKYMLVLSPAQEPNQEAADGSQTERLPNHDNQGHDGKEPAVMIEKLLEPAAEVMEHEREVGHEQDRVEQQLEEKSFPTRQRFHKRFQQDDFAAYST